MVGQDHNVIRRLATQNSSSKLLSVRLWQCPRRHIIDSSRFVFCKTLSRRPCIYKCLSLVGNCARVDMDVYPLLPSFQKAISIIAVGLLFYTLVLIIYKAYFHPLSRFPGPRGAACTRLWLAYMEVGRGVSLSTLRAELHQKYGTLPFALF